VTMDSPAVRSTIASAQQLLGAHGYSAAQAKAIIVAALSQQVGLGAADGPSTTPF